MKILSENELKEFYTGQYASAFPEVDRYGKIPKLLKYVFFDKDEVIADFGCGNGLLLDYVHDKVTAYYGIDFSEKFIAIARQRAQEKQISHAHFICDDITHFCAEHENFFDRAFTLDFSEHIYDDMFLSIYSGIRNSLKKGGMLYLHTPNREFIIERLRHRHLFFKPLPEHVAVRNAQQYRILLEHAGFSKIRVTYVPHYVSLLAYMHRFANFPFMGKYLRARLFIICEK